MNSPVQFECHAMHGINANLPCARHKSFNWRNEPSPKSIYSAFSDNASAALLVRMRIRVMGISAVQNWVLEQVSCNTARNFCWTTRASKNVNFTKFSDPKNRSLSRTVMHAGSNEIDVRGAYSFPRVYDIAFSFRDFEAEAAFLLQIHEDLCNQRLSCFLDVGCGPARHAILLAEAGVPKCLGLDLSQEMIAYAKSCANSRNVQSKIRLVQADMTSDIEYDALFSLKKGEVDLAAIMLGTFSHCLTNTAAIQTLKNISKCEQVHYNCIIIYIFKLQYCVRRVLEIGICLKSL